MFPLLLLSAFIGVAIGLTGIGGILAKEDLDAQRCMAHALGVLKGVPAPQLLKAAHIV